MEPRADRPSAPARASRVPRRCASAMRRSIRLSTSRAGARSSASSPLACAPDTTGAASTYAGAGQILRCPRTPDQSATDGSGRPRRAWSLGRRPHPGATQLRDGYAGRTHHALHTKAPRASHYCFNCLGWRATIRRSARGTGPRWPGTAPRPCVRPSGKRLACCRSPFVDP